MPQQPPCGQQASVVCVVSAGQLIVLVPVPDSFLLLFLQSHTSCLWRCNLGFTKETLKLRKVTELRRGQVPAPADLLGRCSAGVLEGVFGHLPG